MSAVSRRLVEGLGLYRPSLLPALPLRGVDNQLVEVIGDI